MMNDRTFGVEIEIGNRGLCQMADILRGAGFNVYCDDDGSLNNGSVMFDNDEQYSQERPEYRLAWRVISDGSVSGGCEVVSPVLSGAQGLAQVKGVLKAMNKAGAKADARCGLHVHVGAGDLSTMELQHVARRYAAFESTIDTFINPSRRGNQGEYCRSMDGVVKKLDKVTYGTSKDLIRQLGGRYFKLNLQAYLKHGTIEFRQLEGTTSWTKVCNWIEFCVSFVEASRLETNVVQAYATKALEDTKKNPKEFSELVRYNGSDVGIYALSGIMGLNTRPAIFARIDELNAQFPGFLVRSPGYNEYWNVNIPDVAFTSVSYPEVTGTWNTGIPAHVSAHLYGIASSHASTC